LVGWLVRK